MWGQTLALCAARNPLGTHPEWSVAAVAPLCRRGVLPSRGAVFLPTIGLDFPQRGLDFPQRGLDFPQRSKQLGTLKSPRAHSLYNRHGIAAVRSQNAAVRFENEAVRFENEAVNSRNEAVKQTSAPRRTEKRSMKKSKHSMTKRILWGQTLAAVCGKCHFYVMFRVDT